MRLKTPFLGQSYVARSTNLADDQLVNLYPEMALEGKDVGAFFGAPGLEQIFQAGDGPIRGIFNYFNVTLFFVSGQTLYYTDALDVAPVALGTIAGSGRVSITANQDQKVFIAASPNGYIYNLATSTLTLESTLPALGGSNDFIASYFIFEEKNTSYFYIYDGVTFDAADVGTAEGTPDHIVRILVDHREAWIFGQLSTEVWAFTGAADFPLEFIPGALIPQGCAARFTPARLDNSVFWLGRNENGHGVVWRANGYTPQRVSTHAVELAIESYGPDLSDAFSWTYVEEGHSFYCLTFPSANATWCYDAATNMWHQRSSTDPNTGAQGRHRANCATFFQGEIVVGDSVFGKIFTLSLDHFTDGNYGPVTGFTPEMRTLSETDNNQLSTAVVNASAVGYLRTEVLTFSGGTYSRPAQVMVVSNTLGGAAAVTALSVIDAGDYTVVPSNPVTLTGGSGGGINVNAYWTTADQWVVSQYSGSGYSTAPPTLTFDETYGSGAAATATSQLVCALKSTGGTGYLVGETLTPAGGTYSTQATVKVRAIDGFGGVTALSIATPGTYSVTPSGIISLSGGSGSLASMVGAWGMGPITLTAGGTEYSQAPVVTVTGTGVGAAVTAEVDSTTNYIQRVRSWRALPQGQWNGNRLTHIGLLLNAEMGVGLDGTGQGTDPQVMLEWSDDGGHTWSNRHWASMGRIGEYGYRARWPRLGGTSKLRDRVFRLTQSDPVRTAWMGVEMDARMANS